jgi:ABC-type antimicrobial peptide transport system ATPase subunit
MASLSESVLLMKQNLAEVEDHLNKLQGGRKASSSKARASLMALKKSSHALRKQITDHTKAMPTKTRVKKAEEVLPMEEIKQLQAEPEEPEVKKPKARKPKAKKVVV